MESHRSVLGQQAKELAFPARLGPVVATVNEEAIPAAHWYSRVDGAFAIVDGDLFDERIGHGNGQAEYVLKMYFSSGLSAIATVKGAANIAIWDPGQGVFFLLRGRHGEMPCFYTEDSNGLFWSSRVETLLQVGVAAEINEHAVDCFVARGFVPAPWSFIRGIHKVPSGHVLKWEVGRPVTVSRYWEPPVIQEYATEPSEANPRFAALFEQSLRRRYSPKEPIGVLLSGGVDSKLIVAGLNRLLGVAGENIHTFTFRYHDYSGRWNELSEALLTAQHFGTQHEEVVFYPSDIADNLERMVLAFDGPFSYGLHTITLRDIANAGVPALMVGAGPDGWYLDHFEHYGLGVARLPSAVQGVGRALTSAIGGVGSALATFRLPLLARLSTGVARRAAAVGWVARMGLPSHCDATITPDDIRRHVFTDPDLVARATEATLDLFTTAIADFRHQDRRNQISLLHQQTFGAECMLHWLQSCAQAHRLSVRCPYFDEDLFDFAMGLQRMNLNKDEVRSFAASLMPREMAYTPKIAQTVPIREWFRGPLQGFLRDQLSDQRLQRHGVFDRRRVLGLIDEHMSGKANHEWRLWTILTVTVWQDMISGIRGRLKHTV